MSKQTSSGLYRTKCSASPRILYDIVPRANFDPRLYIKINLGFASLYFDIQPRDQPCLRSALTQISRYSLHGPEQDSAAADYSDILKWSSQSKKEHKTFFILFFIPIDILRLRGYLRDRCTCMQMRQCPFSAGEFVITAQHP